MRALKRDREAAFMEAVASLRTKRPGDAAALRRSLAVPPGDDPRVYRVVYPLLRGVDQRDEWRWFLVAGLAALAPRDHPLPSDGPSFGESVRHLAAAERRGREVGRASPLERRFAALLDADARELHVHLRNLVRRCVRAKVGVDLAQLLRDLGWWGHPERRVQRRWGRDFWAPGGPPTEGGEGRDGDGHKEEGEEG